MLISIVTPALNEAHTLPLRAGDLRVQDGEWEWIVADGASDDATVEVARACGARVVHAPRGRARQLDAGAAAATGEVLLFLHADTALPAGALAAIRGALRRPEVAGGNFRLRFDERGPSAVLFEWIYAVQQTVLRTYFGDSAIFVRRAVFDRLGGFGTVPVMEDDAFVRRLERGGRTVRLPLAVVTSARRYRGRPLRTLARWIAIMVLARLGVPPQRLARLYPPHRTQQQAPPA